MNPVVHAHDREQQVMSCHVNQQYKQYNVSEYRLQLVYVVAFRWQALRGFGLQIYVTKNSKASTTNAHHLTYLLSISNSGTIDQ
jgi:hypothetical protein